MDNNWNNWNNWNGSTAKPMQPENAATEGVTAGSVAPADDIAIQAAEFVADDDLQTIPAEETFAEEFEAQDIEAFGESSLVPAYSPADSYDRTASYESASSKKQPGYVTRKGLAIALICTMLATSGLTVGGLALGGVFNNKRVSAYNNNIAPTSHPVASSEGSQLSIQEIAAANENAVVEIFTEKVITDYWLQNYVTQGAGSGVLIDSDGYILTCNHVVDGARSITVTTKNGAQYDAELIGGDEATDIAVLKIKGSNFSTITYGDSSQLMIGDRAVVMGNPLGNLGGSISSGIISALDRSVNVEGKAMTLIQTDAAINPGNSGGGLFDGQGRLIGIVVAKAGESTSDAEGIGFAIPINHAAVIADQLIEYGKVPRPLIGVMIVDITSQADALSYGVNETGLYIDEVIGENAKAAGFKAGDIIKAINGDPIRNRNDLTIALSYKYAGDKVTISVSRDGEIIDIETVLEKSSVE